MENSNPMPSYAHFSQEECSLVRESVLEEQPTL